MGVYGDRRAAIWSGETINSNPVPRIDDKGDFVRQKLILHTGPDIFPLRAVRSSVAKARSVYEVFEARDRVVTDYFEGRHQISGRKAYGFLKQELTREHRD